MLLGEPTTEVKAGLAVPAVFVAAVFAGVTLAPPPTFGVDTASPLTALVNRPAGVPDVLTNGFVDLRPVKGVPPAGVLVTVLVNLSPGRETITPLSDVTSGRFACERRFFRIAMFYPLPPDRIEERLATIVIGVRVLTSTFLGGATLATGLPVILLISMLRGACWGWFAPRTF